MRKTVTRLLEDRMLAYVGKGDAAVVEVDTNGGISIVEPLILQGVDWNSCALLALNVLVNSTKVAPILAGQCLKSSFLHPWSANVALICCSEELSYMNWRSWWILYVVSVHPCIPSESWFLLQFTVHCCSSTRSCSPLFFVRCFLSLILNRRPLQTVIQYFFCLQGASRLCITLVHVNYVDVMSMLHTLSRSRTCCHYAMVSLHQIY